MSIAAIRKFKDLGVEISRRKCTFQSFQKSGLLMHIYQQRKIPKRLQIPCQIPDFEIDQAESLQEP
jgi:hypothetical protein